MVLVLSVRIVHLDRGWQRSLQTRKQILDAVHNADDVRARLPLNIQDHGRRCIHPRGKLIVFDAVHHVGDVRKANRAAVFIRDDQRTVGIGALKLVVGANCERLARAVQTFLSPGRRWRA